MHHQDRIKINVSGSIFETLSPTLSRFPETLLGDADRRSLYLCPRTRHLFFDRHRDSFDAILFFYQSHGKLTCPPHVSVDVFVGECEFFGIAAPTILAMKDKKGVLQLEEDEQQMPEMDADVPVWRRTLWNILERPETSRAACYYAVFSFLIIMLSVSATCLETITSLQQHGYLWEKTELAFTAWFVFEIVLRFACSPDKLYFLKQSLNVIDILIVVPYFAFIIGGAQIRSFGFLRILRFARVMRLLRLSRHSRRLRVIGLIIKSSTNDFRLLFFCFILLNIFGGSILYHIEGHTAQSQINSIPDSLWWALQTVVTLGYGDIIPVTLLGRCFAACYMIFGVLTISLPVLSIVTKFVEIYAKNI